MDDLHLNDVPSVYVDYLCPICTRLSNAMEIFRKGTGKELKWKTEQILHQRKIIGILQSRISNARKQIIKWKWIFSLSQNKLYDGFLFFMIMNQKGERIDETGPKGKRFNRNIFELWGGLQSRTQITFCHS